MSRFDAVGLFWQDAAKEGRGRIARIMPPIPDTGWTTPTSFPNLSAAKVISFDVEAKDEELDECGPFWGRGRGHICGFSVGTDDGFRRYFPVRHEVEPEMNMNPEHAFAWLRDTLAGPQPKVGANLIYDVGAVRSEGITVNGDLIDIQFGEALLEERARVALEILGQKYLGQGKTTSVLRQWCKDYYATTDTTWKRDIYRTPPRLAGPYGEGDADLPMRIAPHIYERLEAEGLLDLFRMECDLIPLLVEMRFSGVRVDVKRAEFVRDDLVKRIGLEQQKLDSVAGHHLEVNSSTQIAKAFDAIGLKYPKTEKGAPSFVKEFLAGVNHPLAASIREIRRLEKLKTTFIEGYVLGKNVNGRLYCSFHPLRGDSNGAVSGRFASSNPNLQNVPIRDEEFGHLIRSIFVHDEGHVCWRRYDQSQIEYRGLVHFAVGPGADEARARFCAHPKTDYHKWTQELVKSQTGLEIERKPIKNLNFGIIYGMGEEKLTNDLHLKSKAEGKAFLAKYHQGVPFAKPTMQAAINEANSTGIVRTILGRRARFDLWEPTKWGTNAMPLPYEQAITQWPSIKRAEVHKALNRKLQGSAADQMKKSMVALWKSGVLKYTGVPKLTVHDELDFSDPGAPQEAWDFVVHTMETALPMRIPLIAEGESGPNWGECK